MRRGRLEAVLAVPGLDLGYLTDLAPTEVNLNAALELIRGVRLLICEAVFLDQDLALARERRHLTARHAGELARAAGAKRLALFHFSPRYEGREQLLIDEAERAFGAELTRLPML